MNLLSSSFVFGYRSWEKERELGDWVPMRKGYFETFISFFIRTHMSISSPPPSVNFKWHFMKAFMHLINNKLVHASIHIFYTQDKSDLTSSHVSLHFLFFTHSCEYVIEVNERKLRCQWQVPESRVSQCEQTLNSNEEKRSLSKHFYIEGGKLPPSCFSIYQNASQTSTHVDFISTSHPSIFLSTTLLSTFNIQHRLFTLCQNVWYEYLLSFLAFFTTPCKNFTFFLYDFSLLFASFVKCLQFKQRWWSDLVAW